MLRMRLNEGVNTKKFAELFGLSFERLFGKYLPTYVDNGFIEKHGDNYSFSLKGRYVSSYILSTMLDFNSDILSGIVNGMDKS